MVLQVKITLAVNKIQGDLVMLREKEAIVTVIGVKKAILLWYSGDRIFGLFPLLFFF